MHLLAQRVKPRHITQRIFSVVERVILVKLRQSIRQLHHLTLVIRHAQPHVRIDDAVLDNRSDIFRLRQINNFERRLRGGDFVEKTFHAEAVDDQNIGGLERFHVLGGELIIVQATDRRLGEIDDFNIVDAARKVERVYVNRIKRRDDPKFAVGALAASAPDRQPAQHNQHQRKNFFHRLITSTRREAPDFIVDERRLIFYEYKFII